MSCKVANRFQKEKIALCYSTRQGKKDIIEAVSKYIRKLIGRLSVSCFESLRISSLSTKSAYVFIEEKERIPREIEYDWPRVWRLNVPERVKIFLWKMLWNRLPTTKWFGNFSGVDADTCCVCEAVEDDSRHILLECKFAVQYWNFVQRKLGYNFVYQNEWSSGGWLKEPENLEKSSGEHLVSLIAISFWLLWKNRCSLKFNGRKEGIYSLFEKAISDVVDYAAKIRSKGRGISNNVSDYDTEREEEMQQILEVFSL
ncbi:hypothetical protein Cni_G20178 [Canna indica]|uniref:Reverse transcriptase zinc-binding domain-containing protein n=1 Tax=Canna indica TaxID=4628 RepID=A0AAQ3QJ89_9LILI|nr:hypothetical protein Cni_G20178 [Canna indica]